MVIDWILPFRFVAQQPHHSFISKCLSEYITLCKEIPGSFGFWNLESSALESVIQIKESGISLMITDQFRFSGKPPTYPSPKLPLTIPSQLGKKWSLKGGVRGQFPRNLNWSKLQVSLTRNPESTLWIPESKTVLLYPKWDEFVTD